MKRMKVAAVLASAGFSACAFATDGYFSHGYGMIAKGMGGAATAMAKDAFGGANNPASMVWVGNRFDVGLDLFAPKRSIERTGSSGFGTGMDGSASADKNLFYIPELGYSKALGPDMAAGITIYGNGGMNTSFSGGQISPATACANGGGGFNTPSGQPGPYNLLCGSGRLGVDMMQLIFAPTFSMKLNKDNSVGASLLVGYQRFKAEGLSAFYGFTAPGGSGLPFAANNNLTDRGYDSSHGYGVRLGWMGKVSDSMTLGAAYTSKMKMSEFDKYKDLFAEQGDFDIPEHVKLGLAYKATQAMTIAFDYERIKYGSIRSVASPSTVGGMATMGTLGCDNCRGFGWSNVDVYKLGLEYQINPNLTLRAGYSHPDNPIQSRDVTFNFLAPAVVKDHLTLGFTHAVGKDADISVAYMHAAKNSVSGPSLFNTWLGDNATDKVRMHEDSLGIAYSMKFQ